MSRINAVSVLLTLLFVLPSFCVSGCKGKSRNGGGSPAPVNSSNPPPAPVQLSILTDSLPFGNVNVSYSGQLVSNGGTPPVLWILGPLSGQLPPGLSLSQAGAITGVPSASGSFGISVRAQDANGAAVERSLQITIF